MTSKANPLGPLEVKLYTRPYINFLLVVCSNNVSVLLYFCNTTIRHMYMTPCDLEMPISMWQLKLQTRCTLNVNKTKVMASGNIACRILIHNEQLEQMDTFPYLGSLITEEWQTTDKWRKYVHGVANPRIEDR